MMYEVGGLLLPVVDGGGDGLDVVDGVVLFSVELYENRLLID